MGTACGDHDRGRLNASGNCVTTWKLSCIVPRLCYCLLTTLFPIEFNLSKSLNHLNYLSSNDCLLFSSIKQSYSILQFTLSFSSPRVPLHSLCPTCKQHLSLSPSQTVSPVVEGLIFSTPFPGVTLYKGNSLR